MKKILLSLILLFAGCQQNQLKTLTPQAIGDHQTAKVTHVLSSSQGQQWFSEIELKKYEKLKEFWEPQKKNYCGVCSIVIVTNTLGKRSSVNQDSLFTEGVKNIILPETVSRMGLTLRELQSIINTNPRLTSTKHYAHTSGLDLFRYHLRQIQQHPGYTIVNFSRQSIAGKGMYSGHFSIVAGYHAKSRQVLIMEVNGDKESFWISDRDLYNAMLAIDPVSRIPRGWVQMHKK